MNFKMFLERVVDEAPLPDDWDPAPFKGRRNFKNMLAYAEERAKEIGSGSSRVAFIIPYEGRDTVLKIAKNNKGIAQNVEEAELFNTPEIKNSGIVIPIIDYDTENSKPRWVHTELAEEFDMDAFVDETNLELAATVSHCGRVMTDPMYRRLTIHDRIEAILNHDSHVVEGLITMLTNHNKIFWEDLCYEDNWGMFKGKPVIIDLGFTEVSQQLYR